MNCLFVLTAGLMCVLQNVDKEKQRSEAKHIGQKKRKALSDLFRELTQLGKGDSPGRTAGASHCYITNVTCLFTSQI